jgi:hypothetical protein
VPVVAPGAPENRRLLDNFSSTFVEGSSVALLPNELAWIESGMVHLEVYNVRTGSTILTAEWGKVNIYLYLYDPYLYTGVYPIYMDKYPLNIPKYL